MSTLFQPLQINSQRVEALYNSFDNILTNIETLYKYPTLGETLYKYPTLAETLYKYPTLAETLYKYPTLAETLGQVHPTTSIQLKYELDGADSLVNGKWVDRINPNVQWTPQGTCKKVDSGYTLQGDSGNLILTDKNQYNLQNHFIVIAIATIDTPIFCIDFGSISNSSKNIGFTASNTYMGFNWKMLGNASDPGSRIQITINPGLNVFLWSIQDAGNGFDKFIVGCNGIVKESQGIVPKATKFNGYSNWQNSPFYIGRGLVNGYYQTQGIIHKFLIFTID